MEIVRLAGSELSVRIRVVAPFFVSQLAGAANESGQATLREWTCRMAEEAEPVVVVEMGELDELSGGAAATLTRGLREAQRLEKGVRLVRCRRSVFDRLRAAGLRGEVWHCGSLAQATEGALTGSDTTTRLHLHPEESALPRLGAMLSALGHALGLAPERAAALQAAVLDAAASAIRRGPPGDPGDRVSLYFHRLPGQLVVEVQDHGDDSAAAHAGPDMALLRRLMDDAEFLPNPTGMLTRLTLRLTRERE
jgi:anti-sigma regulatory factor (Ser/Thr protein kinase)/anti-anti-sigma regulatory factor